VATARGAAPGFPCGYLLSPTRAHVAGSRRRPSSCAHVCVRGWVGVWSVRCCGVAVPGRRRSIEQARCTRRRSPPRQCVAYGRQRCWVCSGCGADVASTAAENGGGAPVAGLGWEDHDLDFSQILLKKSVKNSARASKSTRDGIFELGEDEVECFRRCATSPSEQRRPWQWLDGTPVGHPRHAGSGCLLLRTTPRFRAHTGPAPRVAAGLSIGILSLEVPFSRPTRHDGGRTVSRCPGHRFTKRPQYSFEGLDLRVF